MRESFRIEKIEITKFKKIENAVFELTPDANVFFGGLASGKTSIAEFLIFLLYGSDAVFLPMRQSEDFIGSMTVVQNGKKILLSRRLEGGKESFSFTDEKGAALSCPATPGEALTGLDKDTFDLVAFFEPGRSGAPLKGGAESLAERVSRTKPETEKLYRESRALEQELREYRNEKKTGKLDLAEEKKAAALRLLQQKPALEKELEECRETIGQIGAKLEENDRRAVILKADLAGFTDDRKLLENKENAQSLRRDIQLKEKKLKLLNFDLNGKIGKLSREKLTELKELYNVLSLSISELSEARSRQTVAEEHLSYHRSLFSDTADAESFADAKKDLKKNNVLFTVMRVIGILMLVSGAAAGVLLFLFDRGLAISIASAASLTLVGVACFFLSTLFASSNRKILAEFEKENEADFDRTLELLRAQAKMEEVYSERAAAARSECEKMASQAAKAESAISGAIAALGYTEEDGEILALCDDIIEANETYFDLEDDIETEKREYDALLRADVAREDLELSPGFVTLEKELDFLNRQNASLARRRAALEAQTEKVRSMIPDEAKVAEEIAALEREEEELQKKIRSLEIDLTLIQSRKGEFEKALKSYLETRINERLAFRLAAGARYVFDENFELCYSENDHVLHFSGAGSGIEELGYLALRLSLAELLSCENSLFIFDDPFAFLDEHTAKDLAASLIELNGQSVVTTSSAEVAGVFRDHALVLPL